MGNERTKVQFHLPDSNNVETMWVITEGLHYRLDNIPFYTLGIALNDVVAARADADGLLRFSGLVEASGHCTLRLWFSNATDVDQVRATLRKLGCSSELDLERLVAVDIPPHVEIQQVRGILDELEHQGILAYEESCLGRMST
jgi:hypothetical protein